MEIRRLIRGRYARPALFTLAWLILIFYVFVMAWVSEDAYITLRVVDNFINGYGLRWNVHERVQVYTHPLWLLLHLPIASVWKNLFHVNIALGITCCLSALIITLLTQKKSTLVTLCFFFVPLLCSKSFMVYTTSGLENPLSYLLFAIFGYVVLRLHQHKYFWFLCSFTTALALLNRLDSITLYGPVLAYLVFSRYRPISWTQILLGSLPLVAWFYFALLYYGFFLPNTKYAKLNTGLSVWLYLGQGLYYGWHLFITDMPGALILAGALLAIIRPQYLAPQAPATLPKLPLYFAWGIVTNCIYVICIGGDYMTGRFWAMPIFATVWLWHSFFPARLRPDLGFAAACALLASLIVSIYLSEINKHCTNCIPLQKKIIDGRWIFGGNRLIGRLDPFTIRSEGRYTFGRQGLELKHSAAHPVKAEHYVGMIGYYAGPKATIIDSLALADPLLARLPAMEGKNFYVGHFQRAIPRGYEFVLKTGSLERMSPPLAAYYSKLRIITSGDIFSRERLKTILLFNIGYYDNWRQQYLDQQR